MSYIKVKSHIGTLLSGIEPYNCFKELLLIRKKRFQRASKATLTSSFEFKAQMWLELSLGCYT